MDVQEINIDIPIEVKPLLSYVDIAEGEEIWYCNGSNPSSIAIAVKDNSVVSSGASTTPLYKRFSDKFYERTRYHQLPYTIPNTVYRSYGKEAPAPFYCLSVIQPNDEVRYKDGTIFKAEMVCVSNIGGKDTDCFFSQGYVFEVKDCELVSTHKK